MSPTKLKMTAVTMFSSLNLGHPSDICVWVWVEAKRDQKKGNSICMNIGDGETGCSLVKSLWSLKQKWRGQQIVQTFQDGTGQHEKVQLHFWGVRWGEGNCDAATVTWSHHSLGRSHHPTLHSQSRLSFVLWNHLQVRLLSSSSFLCFAGKSNMSHLKSMFDTVKHQFKICGLISTFVAWSGCTAPPFDIVNRWESIHEKTRYLLFLVSVFH